MNRNCFNIYYYKRFPCERWTSKCESGSSNLNPRKPLLKIRKMSKMVFRNVAENMSSHFLRSSSIFGSVLFLKPKFWKRPPPRLPFLRFPPLKIELSKISEKPFFVLWYRSVRSSSLCVNFGPLEPFYLAHCANGREKQLRNF